MNIAEFPACLRELADQIEAANLPGDLSVELDIGLGLSGEGITDRETLARVARLIGGDTEVQHGIHGRNYLRHWSRLLGGISWSAWFVAGLLGGRVVSTVNDDEAGLRELMSV